MSLFTGNASGMYAVVDIETTGGSVARDRITEIAIYVFDGKRIVDEFHSLVNPEAQIPLGITQLTGITADMVREAPKFYEIAKRIVEITDGLYAGDEVVASPVNQLWLAELRLTKGGGHSH